MHRTLLSLLAAACAAIAASDSCPGHVLDGSCFHCRGSDAHCKSDGSNAQADTPAKCCQACTEVEACNAWSVAYAMPKNILLQQSQACTPCV